MRRTVILLSHFLPLDVQAQWVTQSSGVNSTLLAVDALDGNNIWVGSSGCWWKNCRVRAGIPRALMQQAFRPGSTSLVSRPAAIMLSGLWW
jgi:hypothetical protein